MIGVAVGIITIIILCSGCGEQTGTQKIEKAAEMGKDGQEIIEDTTTIVTSPNTGEQIDAAAGLGTKAGQAAGDRAGSQGRLDRFDEQQEPETKKIDERRNNWQNAVDFLLNHDKATGPLPYPTGK